MDEVEKVARALCRKLDSFGDTEAIEQTRVDRDWYAYTPIAQAAIAALDEARGDPIYMHDDRSRAVAQKIAANRL